MPVAMPDIAPQRQVSTHRASIVLDIIISYHRSVDKDDVYRDVPGRSGGKHGRVGSRSRDRGFGGQVRATRSQCGLGVVDLGRNRESEEGLVSRI